MEENLIGKDLLARSGSEVVNIPDEKIRVIIVPNFPELGRLAALHFLVWVSNNPRGVVSLPTGKTPEHFIHWVKYYLLNWDKGHLSSEIAGRGFNIVKRPDTGGLTFVQMDEFYPIDSRQTNSFCNYVKDYYIRGFGLDPNKALLIDCNQIGLTSGEKLSDIWPGGEIDLCLRDRAPLSSLERRQKEVISAVDEWCDSYEKKIEELGGIGFFLGGIGPDGHIAFNIRGSSHDSRTRLIMTNYETQAAAASDLGGIEAAAKRAVITIGLGTITRNPDCTAIIMAAGEAKSRIVAETVESQPDQTYPGTALQRLKNSAFYLTEGAAKGLKARYVIKLKRQERLTELQIRRAVIDLSFSLKKPLHDLTIDDFRMDQICSLAIEQGVKENDCINRAHEWLVHAVNMGLADRSSANWLHTEPHHDDILLGYLAGIIGDLEDIRQNHSFATFTSGFTAVTNSFLLNRVNGLLSAIDINKNMPVSISMDEAIKLFLKGRLDKNMLLMEMAENIHLFRSLCEVFRTEDRKILHEKILQIKSYITDAYPGQKDPPEIQLLKGMAREWEGSLCWGAFNRFSSNTHHLRLGFYKGDIFNEPPSRERDVLPVVNLISFICPDIMSVALDPEASGPDTHYKVLQVVADAIRVQKEQGKKIPHRIWGYRNVWYRFHPAEANLFLPVSESDMKRAKMLFMDFFKTQKEASFPSPEYNGPFSDYAAIIQKEQYEWLVCCLGKEWFKGHENPMIHSAKGFVFLREMNPEELLSGARAIKNNYEPDNAFEAVLNNGQ